MRYPSLFARVALLSLLSTFFFVESGHAQRQYATIFVSSRNASNEMLAVDNSLTTAARLNVPTLVSTARLRTGFALPVRSGSRAGVVVQVASTLDVSVFNSISIRTYKGPSNAFVQDLALNTLVTLSALSAGKTTVEFAVTDDFDELELRASGVVNLSVDVDLFGAYGTMGPLPVELVTFQGKSTAAGTVLTWSTASERNNDHFVVERATDSPETFRAIGRVQGAGTSGKPTQYQFVDAAAHGLSYYRLRQVDRDGQEEFSPVVAVKAAAVAPELAAYPNPATETLVVTGAAGTRFGVFNKMGQQLLVAEAAAGQRPALDVRSLPSGLYFVRDMATGRSTRFAKATTGQE